MNSTEVTITALDMVKGTIYVGIDLCKDTIKVDTKFYDLSWW
jgi:hypothetical protein